MNFQSGVSQQVRLPNINLTVFTGDAVYSRRLHSQVVVDRAKETKILGVCVTFKTGFEFDDRIYWTFINLLPRFTNHYLRLDTLDF
jgi:hypothetical protein